MSASPRYPEYTTSLRGFFEAWSVLPSMFEDCWQSLLSSSNRPLWSRKLAARGKCLCLSPFSPRLACVTKGGRFDELRRDCKQSSVFDTTKLMHSPNQTLSNPTQMPGCRIGHRWREFRIHGLELFDKYRRRLLARILTGVTYQATPISMVKL